MADDLGSPTLALPNYPDASDFGTTLNEDLPVAAAGAGLIIDATFDSSITNNPNAAAIEATINKAISICQSLFSDPIRVSILFRYSTRGPDGAALAPGLIAQSRWVYYGGPWASYINALKADAGTSNDSAAYSTLPAVRVIHQHEAIERCRESHWIAHRAFDVCERERRCGWPIRRHRDAERRETAAVFTADGQLQL